MATVAEALALALDLHLAGRLAEAGELYRRILDAVPDHADALHLLGVLSGQQGDAVGAAELIGQAIARNPTAPDYRVNLADLLRRSGRLEEAAAQYLAALRLAPARADAAEGLALTAARLGNREDDAASARWYRCALALRPDYADALLNLAVRHSGGDGLVALRGFSRVCRLTPEADLFDRLATLFENVGALGQATAASRSALLLAPDRQPLWRNHGRQLRTLGKSDAAEPVLEHAVALDPDDPQARTLLGFLRQSGRQPAEAVRHYRAALAVDPDLPAVRTALWEMERALGLHGQYYGHEGQDAFIHRTFFPDLTGGVFLDIGAYDGVTWSNTLFFERALGWTGLCVEASPSRYAELVRHRPGPCLNVALSDREGTAEFLDIVDGPMMMGGLAETFTPSQRAFVDTLIQDARTIQVPVRRLDTVLAEHGIAHVHYCSIDTEGAERRIVQSIDFARVTIDVFSLEVAEVDPDFRAYLDSLGYEFVCRYFGGDEIYARRGLKRW